ncbi:MAG: hypothetical protein MHM6MM_004606 [Cercozoa sp. M6MM]
MAEDLSKFDWPSEYRDDALMQHWYAFLPKENDDEKAFQVRLQFWSSLLRDLLSFRAVSQRTDPSARTLAVNVHDLNEMLRRPNGLVPNCMGAVLAELLRREQAIPVSRYSHEKQQDGWVKWLVKGAVRFFAEDEGISVCFRHVSPCFHVPLCFREYSRLLCFFFILDEYESDEALVVVAAAEKLASTLLAKVRERGDFVLSAGEVRHMLSPVTHMSDGDFEIVLVTLQRKGWASVLQRPGESVVKFLGNGEEVPEVTPGDATTVDLRRCAKSLARRDRMLDDLTQRARKQALLRKKSGQKELALSALRQMKTLQGTRATVQKQLQNVEQLLMAVVGAKTDRQVFSAMRRGADTLRDLHADVDDNLENVDDMMCDIADALSKTESISDSLAQPVTQDVELEDEDTLVEQLQRMVLDEDSQTRELTPAQIDDELRRLEADLPSVPITSISAPGVPATTTSASTRKETPVEREREAVVLT